MTSRPLEHELQAQIHDSTAAIELLRVQETYIVDARIAEGIDRGIIDSDYRKHAWVREAELAVIEDVEELRTELQVSRFSEVEALEEAHIKVGAAGRRECVTAHVAHRTGSGLNISRFGIEREVAHDQPGIRFRVEIGVQVATEAANGAVPTDRLGCGAYVWVTVKIHDGPVAGAILVAIGIHARQCRNGLTCLNQERAVREPTAENAVHNAIFKPVREFPGPGNRALMPDVQNGIAARMTLMISILRTARVHQPAEQFIRSVV